MFDHFAKEKSDFLKKKDKSKKGSIDKDIIGIVNLINSKKDFYTTSSCAGRIVLLEMKSRKKNDCNWIFSKHDKVNLKEIIDTLKNSKEFLVSQKSKGFFRTLKKHNKNQSRELPLKAGKKEETSFENLPESSQFIGEARAYGREREPSTKYCERSERIEIATNKTKNKNPIWLKQQPIILHVACRNPEAAKKLLDLARKIFKHSGILSITERKVTVEIIGNERIDTVIADKNFVADEKYLKNLVKYANNNFAENKRKSKRFLQILRSNL